MAPNRRSDNSRERSEEEREHARQERERRRIARAGVIPQAPTPPLPPPEQVEIAPPPSEEHAPLETMPVADREPAPFELASGQEPAPLGIMPMPGQEPAPLETALPPFEPPTPAETGSPAPEQPEAQASFEPPEPPGAARMPMGHLRRPRIHGSQLESRLHPPHLHRPHGPRRRGHVARVAALLALTIVLGALAVGAVLIVRHPASSKTPPLPAVVKVVIPEGYTRAQIAALAHADGLRGSYLAASKRSAALLPSRYGAPAATPSLEGFLFPASYEMYAAASASRLVAEQLAAFRENFGGAEIHRAKVLGVTPYQLLIVASIIEREAAIAHDRPLVAAVIYNRLRQNMALGVDSTLRYALHDFTHPLTEAELASNSPYNTRANKGLPPTPISNPGVAAIKAAAQPANVSYLYYVAGADGCGEQVFSTSYAQFEKNAAAYREALRKNGGRVPTCKKG